MIRKSIYQKDINVGVLKNRAPKYIKQKLTKLKEDIGNIKMIIEALIIHFLFFKGFISLFLERKEKEREGNINVWLHSCPLLGTWLATQACALTGNRTGNSLVRRPALNPLSYTSQEQ